AVQLATAGGDLRGRLRQHPRRRALEHLQRGDARLDLGDELHRGRARAEDGDAPARAIVVVPPLPRGEGRGGGGSEGGQGGDLRLVERAGGGDERARGERADARVDEPAARVVVPPRGGDLGAVTDVARDAVLLGDRAQVAPDLALAGERMRPVRVRRERVRVQ